MSYLSRMNKTNYGAFSRRKRGGAYQKLLKSATWAIDFSRPQGTVFPTLAPRTLPNGVSNGAYLKNVSDDYVLKNTDITALSTGDILGWNIDIYSVASLSNQNTALVGGASNTGKALFQFNEFIFNLRSTITLTGLGWYVSSGGLFIIATPKNQFASLSAFQAYVTANPQLFTIRYQLATPIDTLNSGQINPVNDLVGKVGKNLFDPLMLNLLNGIANYSANNGVLKRTDYGVTCQPAFVSALKSKLKPNTQYTLSYTLSFTGTASGAWGSIAVLEPSFDFLVNGASGRVSGTFNSNKILDTTNLIFYGSIDAGAEVFFSDFQLEEGPATAYEPYGKANVLMQQVGWTSADGYATAVAPNGKTVVGFQADGINTYGVLPSNAPNPVGTQDFAFAFVFKTPTVLGFKSIISRCSLGLEGSQWELLIGSDQIVYFVVGGTVAFTNPILLPSTNYCVFVKRENQVLKIIVNKTELYSELNDVNLVSKNNTRVFARSANEGGTSHASYFDGVLFEALYTDKDFTKFKTEFNRYCLSEYGI